MVLLYNVFVIANLIVIQLICVTTSHYKEPRELLENVHKYWCWRGNSCQHDDKVICARDRRLRIQQYVWFRDMCTLFKENCNRWTDTIIFGAAIACLVMCQNFWDSPVDPFAKRQFYRSLQNELNMINKPGRGWVQEKVYFQWQTGRDGEVPLGAFVLGRDHLDRAIYMAMVNESGMRYARLVDGESCARTNDKTVDTCFSSYYIRIANHYKWLETHENSSKLRGFNVCRRFLFTLLEKKFDAIGAIGEKHNLCLISRDQIKHSVLNLKDYSFFDHYQALMGFDD